MDADLIKWYANLSTLYRKFEVIKNYEDSKDRKKIITGFGKSEPH